MPLAVHQHERGVEALEGAARGGTEGEVLVVLVERRVGQHLPVELGAEGADEAGVTVVDRGNRAEAALQREGCPHGVGEEAEDIGAGADERERLGPADRDLSASR